MKKLTVILLLMALFLTACGKQASEPLGTKPEMQTDPVQTEPTEPSVEPTEEPTLPAETPEMLTAYRLALQRFLSERIFPVTDEPADYDEMFGKMSDNSFAIADVDGDGMRELVLEYKTSYMAGMACMVYGYNVEEDCLYLELSGFPSFVFYDDGLVRADASHNHSYCTDLWPYTLYRFSPEASAYEEDVWVVGWSAEMYSSGYPYDVDTENAGTVYQLYRNGTPEVLSRSAFEKWQATTFSGTELELPRLDLTDENIVAATQQENM